MYALKVKPEGQMNTTFGNSVVQNKSKTKVTKEVSNREITNDGYREKRTTTCSQMKITNFKSVCEKVDSPKVAYLEEIDEIKDFGKNPKGMTVSEALDGILPKASKDLNRIDKVTGTYRNDGPTVFDRNGTVTGHVGRAGRQQALLHLGMQPYYQGGHLISHSLLGKGSTSDTADKVDGWTNIVAMSADLNNLTYKKIETTVSEMPTPANLTIKVGQGKATVDVMHDRVAELTQCPIKNKSLIGKSVKIPNIIAESIDVTANGGTKMSAEEIPATRSVAGSFKNGPQLMGHLKFIGVDKLMTDGLKTKVAGIK